MWDQSVPGRPPEGYRQGTVYTREEINEALQAPTRLEGEKIVPSRDLSGHGTQVAGIAAGNGASSQGVLKGVAPECTLAVVKLAAPRENSFPRTTELIQGIDYLIRLALAEQMPLVINVSFGNNYGSHEPYHKGKISKLLMEYFFSVCWWEFLAVDEECGSVPVPFVDFEYLRKEPYRRKIYPDFPRLFSDRPI